MKKMLFLILYSLISGCSSGRVDNIILDNDESIIIAKFELLDEGINITNKSYLHFKNKATKEVYYAETDSNSYIYLKVKSGDYYLIRADVAGGYQNLPSYFINFKAYSRKICYIGDIRLNLNLTRDENSNIISIKYIIYDQGHQDNPEAEIEDNIHFARHYFSKIFPQTDEIFRSIAVLQEDMITSPGDTLSKSQKRRKMIFGK